MVSYYSVLILMSCMALGVLCILVHENSWIPGEDKRRFYLTFSIIAVSAFTEWLGIQLNGNTSVPEWLLSAVKCADYILTPLAGGAIVAQIKMHNLLNKVLMFILAGNAVFQVIASFNQWMIVIDSQNHYTHGPLYAVYITAYMMVVVLAAIEFSIYGRSYQRHNRASLYSSFLLVIFGIFVQELLGGEFRTAYIAITMGVALMFIHYSEFYHMAADERIRKQSSQLMKDALSGAYSRRAYMKALDKFRNMETLPDNTTVFTVDINGLKEVNDFAGHDAGDKLIIGAARCIEKVIGNTGRCYRTGGDEFVAITRMDKERAQEAVLRFEREAERRTKNSENKLSVSAGFATARDYPSVTIDKLTKEADRAMYAAKAEYYRKHGIGNRSFAYNTVE